MTRRISRPIAFGHHLALGRRDDAAFLAVSHRDAVPVVVAALLEMAGLLE